MDILKQEIENNYNIKIVEIEKNTQSIDGNVYIINTRYRKYVVKIYKEIEHVKSMIGLYTKLKKCGIYVPKIIKTKKKEKYTKLDENKYIVIYSFLKGKQISTYIKTQKLDENKISIIAKTLKKMHNITREENEFNLPKIPFKDPKEDLICSVLHFDLTKDNIFIKENKFNKNCKIGFIDFDDAKYGPSACDVAIIVAILFFSKKGETNFKGIRKFIAEYYYGDEVIVKASGMLSIRYYAINWIDYILKTVNLDESTRKSFLMRKKLIKKSIPYYKNL